MNTEHQELGPANDSSPASGSRDSGTESANTGALHKMVCACGCGTKLKENSKGKMPHYAQNHHHRGKEHSKEWCLKQSSGVKKAWDDGKYESQRHHSRERVERRVAKIRGQKRTPEICEKMRVIAKNAHDRGAYASEQTRQKYRANLLERIKQNPKLYGQSREWMIAIQSKRDMARLAADNSKRMTGQIQEWKESGTLDVIRRRAGNAIDMPDHLAAKQWTIRDPVGRVYKFSNLSSWSRKHENLFEDCAPASKTPHWRRISCGIAGLLSADGRSCSYRGWVAVGKTELEAGAPDLLAREPQSPELKNVQSKTHDQT
jgi:gas vesicle protein